MALPLIGLLLLGEGWFLVYIVALVISLAIVIPKVRRLKQPVGAWGPCVRGAPAHHGSRRQLEDR